MRILRLRLVVSVCVCCRPFASAHCAFVCMVEKKKEEKTFL